jgi:hypothetical protein
VYRSWRISHILDFPLTQVFFVAEPPRAPRRFYKRRADVVFAIYIAVVQNIHGAFPAISGASKNIVLKFGIHQEQSGRKGVRRGEEERMSREVESQYS